MAPIHRLTAYRRKAENAREQHPGWVAAHDWRYWQKSSSSRDCLTRRDGKWFVDSLDSGTVGENLGDAHNLARLDHTGWYADNFQHSLIKGAVVKLRTSQGTYYIPSTYSTEWDGVTLYMDDAETVPPGSGEDAHDDAIRSTAIRADMLAEMEAERAREDDAKDQAEQAISDARAEIHQINRETLALIRESREHGDLPATICETVKKQVRANIQRRAELFERIASYNNNFWNAVPIY